MKTLPSLAFAMVMAIPAVLADDLQSDFLTPPDSSRPGVYWYFMDGNQDRKEMVADLHAIHKFNQRVEESTLCIYRDKVFVLAGDGYVHALK